MTEVDVANAGWLLVVLCVLFFIVALMEYLDETP